MANGFPCWRKFWDDRGSGLEESLEVISITSLFYRWRSWRSWKSSVLLESTKWVAELRLRAPWLSIHPFGLVPVRKWRRKWFLQRQTIASVSLFEFKWCIHIAFNNSFLILLITFREKSPLTERRSILCFSPLFNRPQAESSAKNNLSLEFLNSRWQSLHLFLLLFIRWYSFFEIWCYTVLFSKYYLN